MTNFLIPFTGVAGHHRSHTFNKTKGTWHGNGLPAMSGSFGIDWDSIDSSGMGFGGMDAK